MASQLSNYREAFSSASDYYGNQAIRFRGVHKSQETKYRKLEALSKIMERHAAELAPPSGLSLEILAREAGKTEAFPEKAERSQKAIGRKSAAGPHAGLPERHSETARPAGPKHSNDIIAVIESTGSIVRGPTLIVGMPRRFK